MPLKSIAEQIRVMVCIRMYKEMVIFKIKSESYFSAETLKYLYLLFSSNRLVDLKKELFTTEGHILPIRNRFFVCS